MKLTATEYPPSSVLGVSEIEGSPQELPVIRNHIDRALQPKGEDYVRQTRGARLATLEMIKSPGCPERPLE
jgi:hypothetical protein